MSGAEPEVIEGRFWLPHDRHRSYGRIEHDLRDGARIHLVDTNLAEWDEGGPRGPGPIELLHGETLGGAPLTLLGVYTTHWTRQGAGPSAGDTVDAFIGQLLVGVYSADGNIPVAHAGVRLHGLRELLTGGVVDRAVLWPDPDERFSADTLVVALPEAELTLMAARHTHLSRGEERSEISASAGFAFEVPVTLPAVQSDYVRVLEDLVLFATRRSSFVVSLTISPDEDEVYRRDIKVIQRSGVKASDEREVYALALNLADEEDPAALVARWFELRRRVGPVWNVFFAALDRGESLLEDRLLGLLSFAEGYHRALHDKRPLTGKQEKQAKKAMLEALDDADVRRVYRNALSHANQQTQRDRLEMLADRALAIVGEWWWWWCERDVVVSRLIHTRNWLVHWGKRQADAVDDPAGMVELVRGLVIVIYVNVLLDLGLSVDATARVIGSGWRLEGPPEPVFADESDEEDEEDAGE